MRIYRCIFLLLILALYHSVAQADFVSASGTANIDCTACVCTDSNLDIGEDCAVTGVGFTPKALIVILNNRESTSDAVGNQEARMSMGFASGADVNSHASTREALGTGNKRKAANSLDIIDLRGSGITMDLQSFDADGFTLNSTADAGTASTRYHWIAIGGSDITNVKAGTFVENIASGDVTDPGFQPDAIILMDCDRTDVGGDGTDSECSIGAAVAGIKQAVFSASCNQDSDPSQCISYTNDVEVLAKYNGGSSDVIERMVVDSFDSLGFNISWSEGGTGTNIVHYLAIKGGQWDLVSDNTLTSIADLTKITLSFESKFGLLFSHNLVESTTDTVQDHAHRNIGVWASSTSERAMFTFAEDGDAGANSVHTGIEHNSVYGNLSNTPTLNGNMSVKTIESDGITFTMDVADAAGNFFWFITGGPTAATTTAVRRRIIKFN